VPSFAVYEPPNPPADRLDRAVGLVFLKDGFAWSAPLFAPLWMLAHRLWWPLFGYLVALGLLLEAGSLSVLRQKWIVLGLAALNVAVGLEAGPLRMWSLARRGWNNLGSVTGKTLAECERRFIEAWLPSQPSIDLGTPQRGASRARWWRWKPLSMRI
jgi:hypothetical protein